jgi:hypothetical protein
LSRKRRELEDWSDRIRRHNSSIRYC